jgi:hypothetical protein
MIHIADTIMNLIHKQLLKDHDTLEKGEQQQEKIAWTDLLRNLQISFSRIVGAQRKNTVNCSPS